MLRKISFASALLLFLCFCPTTFGQQQRQRLAVISSYHESAPWVRDLFTALTLDLSDRSDILIDPVYMNATLITDQEIYDRTVDGVFRHFKDKTPDYVLLFGGMCISLLDRIVEEWGDIPIVCVAKTNLFGPRPYYFTSETVLCTPDMIHSIDEIRGRYNFTFIQYPDLYKQTVDMMLRMQPAVRKIVMLADATYNNRHLAIRTGEYIRQKYPDIEYEWLVSKEENVPELQSLLTTSNDQIGLLLCSWFYGRTGTLGDKEIITGGINLIPSVQQPVFSLRKSYLYEGGILGGYFVDEEQVRESILSAVQQMLADVPMRAIPFVFEQNLSILPIVDYSLLEKKHISPSLCPEGTVFINKEPSFFSKYKWPFFFVLLILLLVFVLIGFRIVWQRKQIKFYKRLETLLANVPIGYTQGKILQDKEGKVFDIEYHSSNHAFLDLLKLNSLPEEPDKIFPKPFIAEQVNKLLKDKKPCAFVYHFKRTDTYYSFVLCLVETDPDRPRVSHANRSIDIFAIDITQRSKGEKELRRLTDKLKFSLQLTQNIPWRWNLKKHEISYDLYILQKSKKPFRRRDESRSFSSSSSSRIRETSFLNRIHPEDKEKVQELYLELEEGKAEYIRTEFRVCFGEMRTEWVEINAAIIEKDEHGKPTALTGCLLVITSRKEQEEHLIQAREQALESDRMKSAFLANMSHEIRTPLNAIVGFSGLLAKTDDPAKKQKFAELIESNNGLLLQLISDVLDFAKVESNTLDYYYQMVDLNELMSNIEKSIRFKLKEGVELKCVMGAETCMMETDPNRLAQVVNNLLANSCKFTTQGCIEFGYEVKGKNLYFYVKDTGIGIPFENQQSLFKRFSKLNNFAQGTGLGLSICKGIVEKMGGCIGVVSAGEGKGSKFWFTLPLEAPEGGSMQNKEGMDDTEGGEG